MPATYSSRLEGITTSVSFKPPCVVRTTANITLSGTQTIDGVAVVADDRVLVVAQTTSSENGIWNASATAWERADDFDGAGDVVKGTLVTVLGGSTISGSPIWQVTSANPITIGTSNITFSAASFQMTGSVGTLAAQNATAVNIDGGTIDGTAIGASSASTGVFTTLNSQYLNVTSATKPANGAYLVAANTVGITANTQEVARFGSSGTVVNYITLLSRATGSSPVITAAGEASVGLIFAAGTGGFSFQTSSVEQFAVANTASAVNRIRVTGGAAGSAPFFFINGSDTDVDFKITPKNAGLFQLGNAQSFTANNSHTVTISALAPIGVLTATIKKWVTIKDSGGTTLYIPAWGA